MSVDIKLNKGNMQASPMISTNEVQSKKRNMIGHIATKTVTASKSKNNSKLNP